MFLNEILPDFDSVVFFYASGYEKSSQLTFNCSNSTIKTPEKGVKYVQS